MLPLVRTASAEQDLACHADFLAQQSPQAAIKFLSAAEAAFNRIETFPEIAGVYETTNQHLQGFRAWPIPGFPYYLIFYLIQPNHIEVVRVLHGARDLEHFTG